jgi:hypothetical protein
MFYVDGKKIIPLFVEKLLNPLSLAVWLMDDGSAHNSGGCIISTNSFTFEECLLLQTAILKK